MSTVDLAYFGNVNLIIEIFGLFNLEYFRFIPTGCWRISATDGLAIVIHVFTRQVTHGRLISVLGQNSSNTGKRTICVKAATAQSYGLLDQDQIEKHTDTADGFYTRAECLCLQMLW